VNRESRVVFVLLAMFTILFGNGCGSLGAMLSAPPSAATSACNAPTGPILYGYWERYGMFTANIGVGLPGIPGYDPCSGRWAQIVFERPPSWPAGDFCVEDWSLNAKEVPTGVYVDRATGKPRGVVTSFGRVSAPNGHSILSLRVDNGAYHWPVQFRDGEFPMVSIQNSQDYAQVMYVSIRGKWGSCQ
jgi:hypothetical protein